MSENETVKKKNFPMPLDKDEHDKLTALAKYNKRSMVAQAKHSFLSDYDEMKHNLED